MLETSQNFMEREVLLLLRRLHAEAGPVTRERLTVMGRGRGLEVARSLLELKALGLIQIVEKRPPFWRRLFGAKTQEFLVPVPQAEEPVPDLAAPEAAPPAILPLETQPEPVALAPVAFEAPPEPAAPPYLAPLEPPPLMEAPLPPQSALLQPEAPAYEPPPAEILPPPVVIPAPPPLPQPVPQPAAPRRVVPQGFTDEIGGAPADFNLAPRLDPELVEGMRDFLAGMGLEMTFAGEAFAAHRLQGGAVLGDVVMQLVVFALAHAAHHETLSEPVASPEGLRDYAQAMLEELERLAEAGEIPADRFAENKGLILQLADRASDRGPLVAALLADPVGGAAPPALLPEELRGVEDGLDEISNEG